MDTTDGEGELLLIHNPGCTKSRALKAALEERGLDFRTRLYLEDPLDAGELRALFARLGRSPLEAVRPKEPEFAEAGLGPESSSEVVIAAVARHPRLLERPVLVQGDRAAIGRPIDVALALLEG